MSRMRGGLAVQLLCVVLAACGSATPTPPADLTPSPPSPSGASSTATPSGPTTTPDPGNTSTPASPVPTEPSRPAGPATGADQIIAALEAGEIDFPTSLLYRLYSLHEDPRLPAEFNGPPDVEDEAAFMLASDPALLLSDDLRALMQTYLVRPTDPLSAFSGVRETGDGTARVFDGAGAGGSVAALSCDPISNWASQSVVAGPIKVWARCTGSYEADIAAVVAVVNAIYGPMTAYMGEPILDLGTDLDGGDNDIDLYLTDDVSCPPEIVRCVAIARPTVVGRAMRDFPYGQPPGMPSSAWMTMRRSGLRDRDQFRRTMIHEFFHVLQFTHNSVIISGPTGARDTDGTAVIDVFWFAEASAEWSEYHFERKLGNGASAKVIPRDDFVNGYQFTDASLHAQVPKMRRYEAFIWPFFMVQEKGENVVANVWRTLADATDWDDAMGWISTYLPFESNFRDFAVRNINMNVAGSGDDPIPKRYKDFDATITFPDGKPSGSMWHSLTTIEAADDPVPYPDTIKPLSAHYWRFDVADSVEKFEFDFSGLGDGNILDVDALLAIWQDGPGSEVKWEHRKLADPKAKFCRSIPEEDVAEMYLVLSNHEREQINLSGTFTIDATEEPCRGFEVTMVRDTVGGPWDPTKYTLTAVLEPDEEGEEDGILEAYGRGFGSYLGGDMEEGCKQFGYSGVIFMNAQIIDEMLNIYAAPYDPFTLDLFGAKVPEEGGTVVEVRPPELGPGDPVTGIPSCYAFSKITWTTTVKPLEPEQD